MRDVKIVLVGECNPLSQLPEHALYPYPPGCSGARLQKILAMPLNTYLATTRVNLCVGKWSMPVAREKAAQLLFHHTPAVFVLLGRKVSAAFNYSIVPPFGVHWHVANMTGTVLVHLPHPSGRCTLWNNPENNTNAREAVKIGVRMLSKVLG